MVMGPKVLSDSQPKKISFGGSQPQKNCLVVVNHIEKLLVVVKNR